MNQPEDAPSKRISELLGKLQAQPDAAQITLQGRATSRSETNLHLAVSSGIVAIPIDEIEDVVPLSTTTDPTLVSVLVKDASKVRHLLKVRSTMGAAEGSGSQAAGTQIARRAWPRRVVGSRFRYCHPRLDRHRNNIGWPS